MRLLKLKVNFILPILFHIIGFLQNDEMQSCMGIFVLDLINKVCNTLVAMSCIKKHYAREDIILAMVVSLHYSKHSMAAHNFLAPKLTFS